MEERGSRNTPDVPVILASEAMAMAAAISVEMEEACSAR